MTFQKVCHSLAPRSFEASSNSRLNPAIRERTTMATNGNVKAIWAAIIADRLNGQIQPVGKPVIREKKASIATPMQISGTTIGNAITPSYPALNGNLKRHSSMATIAPRTVAMIVVITAIVIEFIKASNNESLFHAFSYYLVVNPRHTTFLLELLKLKIISVMIGA